MWMGMDVGDLQTKPELDLCTYTFRKITMLI